ncbi:MAG: hypothetical protein N2Z21_10445 [Candidatus Sumerlaeaceae bacterium]|nr:hypothetical protein [Candidatus Sumerlaeaceae bacterium]
MLSRIFFGTSFMVILSLACAASSPQPPITTARKQVPRYTHDPLAVRAINPVFDAFPDSSLVDFSFLLDPPAGKHGWVLRQEDGSFRFEKNNERVRFWGYTVAATHAGDIEKSRIELVTDVLARAGCNLLRLHELDNRGGEQYNLVRRCIIDEGYPNNNKSTEFDPEYRDRVDWWIACAKKRGMYVYLVIRGYRTFREGDGVPNADKLGRAAKPYAFFDPRLIELQKQYAQAWLFDHVNPYTGMPNGLDPAVCMLEIENEDSLFFGHVPWRQFAEPYRTNFHKMWNEWLRAQYGSTAALRQAWTNAAGACPLKDNESLENGSVELPDMSQESLRGLAKIGWDDQLRSPARTRDGVRFAVELQRRYFATMRDFLRSRGARMPLVAVVHGEHIVDIFTTTRELDATAENAYLDHPSFLPGVEWVGKPFYSNKNYVREIGPYSMACHLSRYRWATTPLVCREWTQCWPNEYRSAYFPDIASFSLAQDYDMLVHFAYYTWGDQEIISAFGPQADPLRWGVNGYTAKLFLRDEVPVESHKVRIAYNNEDLATWASFVSPLHQLAWRFRLENWNPDEDKDGTGALVTVTSGRSGTGAYKGNRLVLFDARYQERADGKLGAIARGLLVASGYDYPWIYKSPEFDKKAVEQAGFVPVLCDSKNTKCKAFYDPKRQNLVCAEMTETSAAALANSFADFLLGRANIGNLRADWPAVLELAEGTVRRHVSEGLLTVATTQTCVLAGEFVPGKRYQAGVLEVVSTSPVATIYATSLDGKPLNEAQRFAVKMVTAARNRGQQLEAVKTGTGAGKYVLNYQGSAPVQTGGKSSSDPTSVWIGGWKVVEAYLANGTWEVVVDRTRQMADVFCDTPNVRFVLDPEIFGASASNVPIQKFFTEYPPVDAQQRGNDFIYPGFAKYVRLGGAGVAAEGK